MIERLRILKSASEVKRSGREMRQCIVADRPMKTQAKTVYRVRALFINREWPSFWRVFRRF